MGEEEKASEQVFSGFLCIRVIRGEEVSQQILCESIRTHKVKLLKYLTSTLIFMCFKTGMRGCTLRILSICVIRKAASSPDYPRVLNVTKIISLNAINDIWQEEKFLFINSKVYLNDLAMHVAVKKPKVVKVVIGFKDAGKSTGIVTLQKYWRQQGHVIVDVNLKGVSHHTNGKEAMYIISKQLKHQLSNFDMESFTNVQIRIVSKMKVLEL